METLIEQAVASQTDTNPHSEKENTSIRNQAETNSSRDEDVVNSADKEEKSVMVDRKSEKKDDSVDREKSPASMEDPVADRVTALEQEDDADIPCADASDADIPCADASDADIPCADASDADIPCADASDADISCADASDADIPCADASDADIPCADASDDDIPCADASDADIPCADASDDAHGAVEADYVPVGSSDSVVESGIEMDPSDEEELGDTSGLNAEERNRLFARGLSHDKGGKKGAALRCYISCLSGLSRHTRFVLLPQCLRNISDIYYENQEYEKAIHFIQAEKLYYENALINTDEIQKKLEELTSSRGGEKPSQLARGSGEPADIQAMETQRAEEYEHLAKLCRDRHQPQLALEYAGKCTRLRQELFGERHPKTLESLDFFASLYAEVGKQQYTDCMQTLDSPAAAQHNSTTTSPGMTDSEGSTPSTPTGDGTPVSILRHRKNSDREKKQVRFHESVVDNSHQRVQEEWLSRTLVTMLLFLCFLFLTVFGLGLYCRMFNSQACHSLGEAAHNAYLQLRYQYYKYTSTKHVKFA